MAITPMKGLKMNLIDFVQQAELNKVYTVKLGAVLTQVIRNPKIIFVPEFGENMVAIAVQNAVDGPWFIQYHHTDTVISDIQLGRVNNNLLEGWE
jgi:hypothetical protein